MSDIKNDPVGFVMNWANRQKERADNVKSLADSAKAVYNTYHGRVLLDSLLDMLVLPSADPEPHMTYYNEGQRAVAIWLNNLLKPEAQEPAQTQSLNQPEEG